MIIAKSGGGEPVLKGGLIGDIAPPVPVESTLDGKAIAWPYDPNSLFQLYKSSSEHGRCCQIKAECACGVGVANADEWKPFMPRRFGAASFFSRIELDLETYGNAFIEVIRAGGRVVGIDFLPARTMYVHSGGGFVQWVYEVDGSLVEVDFTEREVVHLRVPCTAGLHYSLPTWVSGTGMLELVHAAIEYNAAFFRNRSVPDYAIVTKGGQLGEKSKESVKAFFRDEFSGASNAHRAIYVPIGSGTEIDFKKLTEDRKDADFLAMMDACRERIVTAHGVPPRMLGIMSSGQLGGGSEAAVQAEIFELMTLAPRRRRLIEQIEDLSEEMGLAPPEFQPLRLESVTGTAPPSGSAPSESLGHVGS